MIEPHTQVNEFSAAKQCSPIKKNKRLLTIFKINKTNFSNNSNSNCESYEARSGVNLCKS